MTKTKENTIIEKSYELIKFEDGDFSLDVNVSNSEDTVWLNLEQLSLLFERDKSVISRHISNIIKELELSNDSTIAFFAMVQLEGDRRVERSIPHYNLFNPLNKSSYDGMPSHLPNDNSLFSPYNFKKHFVNSSTVTSKLVINWLYIVLKEPVPSS